MFTAAVAQAGSVPLKHKRSIADCVPTASQGQRTKPAASSLSRGASRRETYDTVDSAASPGSEYKIDEDFVADSLRADKKPWIRRWSLWRFIIPFCTCFVLIAAGVVLRIFQPFRGFIRSFELWRWFIFAGSLGLVWWLGSLIVHTLANAVLYQFFATRNVVYYVIAIRKPLGWFVRALLVIPLYVALFYPAAHTSSTAFKVYDNVLKFIGCVLLFTSANVMSTLLSKILASHFHKATHFALMQEAVRKEFYLQVLSQPRVDNELTMAGVEADVADSSQKAAQLPMASRARSGALRFLYESLANPMRALSLSMPKKNVHSRQPVDTHADVEAPAGQARGQQAAKRTVPSPHTTRAAAHNLRNGPPSPYDEDGPRCTFSAFAGEAGGAGAPLRMRMRPARCISLDYGGRSAARSQVMGAPLGPGGPSQRGAGLAHRLPTPMWNTLGGKASNVPSTYHETSSVQLPDLAREVIRPDGRALAAKLHAVEKHLRKHALVAGSLVEQIGSTAHARHAERDAERQSRALAFFLFWNIKQKMERNYIAQEDFEAFLPPDQAVEAFGMLDEDGNGQLTLQELRFAVANILRQRANLAAQLKDTKSVVGRLKMVIGVCLHVLMLFFYLLIFSVDIQKLWVFVSSVFIGFAFIFGNSVRNLFEAVIFLFVVHPFDTGDSLVIDNLLYVVEEISLNTCTLLREDGARFWYPNTKLQGSPLLNLSRSNNKREIVKMQLDVGTPAGVVEAVLRALRAFIEARPHEYDDFCEVFVTSLADPLKLGLEIVFFYANQGLDLAACAASKTAVMMVVSDTLSRHGVQVTAPTQPYVGRPPPAPIGGAGLPSRRSATPTSGAAPGAVAPSIVPAAGPPLGPMPAS